LVFNFRALVPEAMNSIIENGVEMDRQVCKACSKILQTHSPLNDAGEPSFKRVYHVSQRALETSDCPVCERFLQDVQDIRPQREKLLDAAAELDTVEIILNDNSGSGNFLSLESPGVKQKGNHYFDLYADEER